MSKSLDKLSKHQKGKPGESLTRAQERAKEYMDKGKFGAPAGGLTPTGRSRYTEIDHNFENVVTGKTKVVESKFGTKARLGKNQRSEKKSGINSRINKMTPDSTSGAASGSIAGGAVAGGSSDSSDEDEYWR